MGGEARIVTYASDVDSAMQATRTAFGVMARIEDALSDYRERSEVETIVRTVGAWQTTGPDLRHALFVSDRWRRLSGGAFDPAIGATTRLWRRARRVGIPPSPEAREVAASSSGWRHVEFDAGSGRIRMRREGVHLDFGAVGKGIAADAALAAMVDAGFPRTLVDLGGDIVVGGPPPGRGGWAIGQDGPPDVDAATWSLTHAAIATSGDRYQHIEDPQGRRMSHLLDARTLEPTVARGEVTVVVHSGPEAGASADVLASVANVLSADELRNRFDGEIDATVIVRAPAGQSTVLRLRRVDEGAQ